MQNLQAVVELSRGARWKPRSDDPPYLIARDGQLYPEGGSAWIVFYDTAGTEITTIDLEVTPQAILPNADADDVADIPAGARFEIFLDDGDGVDQIRHGVVIRREAPFLEQPPIPGNTTSLSFTDTFPTLGLKSSWKPVLNRVKVWDNGGTNPNGMATDKAFFDKGAVRWESPLNSDNPRMHTTFATDGNGKTTAIFCADQRFSSGNRVQVDTIDNKIHIGVMSDPITLTDKETPVSHTLVTLNDYYMTYSDVSKTAAIWKGTDLTPLASWTDSLNEVPHGLGYRYLGYSFQASLLNTGPRVCAFSAKDDV